MNRGVVYSSDGARAKRAVGAKSGRGLVREGKTTAQKRIAPGLKKDPASLKSKPPKDMSQTHCEGYWDHYASCYDDEIASSIDEDKDGAIKEWIQQVADRLLPVDEFNDLPTAKPMGAAAI